VNWLKVGALDRCDGAEAGKLAHATIISSRT
jgi:hypothetical protein